MSKLEEWIAELCPDGVEYKTLGTCVEKIQNIKWADNKESEYRYIDLTSVDREKQQITETQFINSENAPSRAQQIVHTGDVLFGTTRPLLKRYCFIGDEYDGQICSTGLCVLRGKTDIVLQKWIFHQIASSDFFKHVEKYQKGASYPAISDIDVKSFEIPVPPLPVQHEIVRILDNFTELTAELTTELTAELTARKKQYEYYKKSLLSQSSTAFVTKLGEVATLKTGSKPKEIFEEKDKFDYINAGTSNSGYTRAFNCEGDTVTTPSRGQGGIGFVGYQKNSFWLGPLCYRIKSKDTNILLNRYLYHYLSCFKDKILQYKKEGGTPSVNSSDLVNIAIDIPSIDEQKRIIAILDRFDTLYNDLNSGLSAEIAARCKQYEYYRDNLLTFKEASA